MNAMIVLNTNVVSELMLLRPISMVIEWVSRQSAQASLQLLART